MHKTDRKRGRAITKWGAKVKKKNSQFDNALKIIWHFGCTDNIFDYCLYREKG